MNSLPEIIPDENYLLSLEAEELAGFVLMMAKKQMQNAMLHQGNFSSSLFQPNQGATNTMVAKPKSKWPLLRHGIGWKYKDCSFRPRG